MKNWLNLYLIISSIVFVSGQEKLIVEYELFTKMDAKSVKVFSEGGGISQQEIENAVKKANESPSYYTLLLTQNESKFEFVEKVDNEQNEPSSMSISFGPRGAFYKNLSENTRIQQTQSWDKDFLIVDSIKTYDWKITKEVKEILGYEVRKASAIIDSTKSLTAWYAPKLAYKNGPENFNGLPGLILEIEQISTNKNGNNQTQTYTAISLNVASEKSKIEKPKKGKIVTTEEFKKFSDEQMAKMKEMYEGGVDKE